MGYVVAAASPPPIFFQLAQRGMDQKKRMDPIGMDGSLVSPADLQARHSC